MERQTVVQAKTVRRWVVALVALLAAAALLRAGPREAWGTVVAVADTARHLPAGAIAAALAFGLLQNLMAIVRLHVLVRSGATLLDTIRRLALPQLLNAVAPARAGDLAKLAVVAEHGGVARAAGTVLVADKVADVAGGALALLLGVAAGGSSLSRAASGAVAAAIVGSILLALAARAAVRRAGGRGPIGHALSNLLESTADASAMAPATIAATVGWLAEAAALLALSWGTGGSLSPGGAMLALLVLNVGILVPLLPANAGTFEAALGFALVRLGVAGPAAIAISTVHHAIQLLMAAVLALLGATRGGGRGARGASRTPGPGTTRSYPRSWCPRPPVR